MTRRPLWTMMVPGSSPESLKWLLQDSDAEHVLDLGAGTGALSRGLHAAGYRVTAVDPDDRMLAVLRETVPQVSTAVGTAEAVPLPDGSVDAYSSPRHCVRCDLK